MKDMVIGLEYQSMNPMQSLYNQVNGVMRRSQCVLVMVQELC